MLKSIILNLLASLYVVSAFHNHFRVTLQRPIIRQLPPLRRGNFFDDDLPSILGINPIEAAIIAGGLYYVYGPDKLYELAREAGRYVSTYGPLLKQASLDIFYEFRDYFEEDREREQLRKAGVDISNLPRRTSNIVERFQAILSQFSETTQGSSEVLRTAYRSPESSKSDSEDDNEGSETVQSVAPAERNKKRKTKREVLIERNVDVNKVIEATTAIANSNDEDLAQSISIVENSLTNLKSVADAQLPHLSPPAQQQQTANTAFTNPLSTETITMSKFQQQLSGEWNTRVLRRSRYEDTPLVGSFNGNRVGSSSSNSNENIDEFPNSFLDDSDDDLMTDDEYQKLMMADSSFNSPYDDLTQFDQPGPGVRAPAPEIEDLESSPVPLPMPPFDDYQPTSFPASGPSTSNDVEAEQFLKEIDRDYLTLRSKILAYMQAKQQAPIAAVASTEQVAGSDINSSINNVVEQHDDSQFVAVSQEQQVSITTTTATLTAVGSSSSMDKQKKKYWPPQRTATTSSRISLE